MSDFHNWQLGTTSPVHGDAATDAVACRPILSCVTDIARQYGDLVAVQTEQVQLTYRELYRMAKAVSGWLRTRQVGAEDRIVLLADKTAFVYPALLGVLGVNAAFVPLETEAPVNRIRQLIQRTTAKAVVTTAELAAEIDDIVEPILLVDDPLPFQQKHVTPVLGLRPSDTEWRDSASDLAYLMFTSGSSGAPKGVAIERHSVDTFAHTMAWITRAAPGARLTQGARLCFDAALQHIVAAFSTGATLVPVPDETRAQGDLMARWLRDNRITHWDSVPSLWAPVLGALGDDQSGGALPDLDTLILAGESPVAADINRWLGLMPHVRLFNAYGPTEATVNATAFQINTAVDGELVPIGSPLPGVDALIVDAAGHVCDPFVEGEIYLGGDGLARGYLEDPGQTEAAFVRFDDGAGQRRMYRTGDLGYRQPDGNLVFTGRRDEQVKISGVRVEPTEVESVLRGAPGVVAAAVVGYRPCGSGALKLAAAVVGSTDTEVLRAHLAGELPVALLPTLLIPVAALPRTPSEKVDHRAVRSLAERYRHSPSTNTVDDPALEVVRSVCQRVLGVSVGLDDDLLACGLDSVSGLRLRAELAACGISVRGKDLFAQPTVIRLAGAATKAAVARSEASSEIGEVTTEVPLLPSQRPLVTAAAAVPRSSSIGLVQEVHMFGAVLDKDVLVAAAEELVARHDVFRTGLSGDATNRRQCILSPGSVSLSPAICRVDDEIFDEATARIADQEFLGFDIRHPPLLRLSVALSDQRTALIWTMHHFATDGWSWELVCRDFICLYSALSVGSMTPRHTGPPLKTLARLDTRMPPGAVLQDLLGDLSSTVAVSPERSPAVTEATERKGSIEMVLSERETRHIEVAAVQAGVTPSAVVLNAVGAALSRLVAEPDITIGVVSSGRHIPVDAVEKAVAPLARITPVTWHAARSTVKTAHDQLIRAISLEPFDLDAALNAADIPIGLAAPQTTFVSQNYTSGLPEDTQARRLGFDDSRSYSRESAHSDLAIVVHKDPRSGIAIRAEYWPHRIEKAIGCQLLRETRRELLRTEVR